MSTPGGSRGRGELMVAMKGRGERGGDEEGHIIDQGCARCMLRAGKWGRSEPMGINSKLARAPNLRFFPRSVRYGDRADGTGIMRPEELVPHGSAKAQDDRVVKIAVAVEGIDAPGWARRRNVQNRRHVPGQQQQQQRRNHRQRWWALSMADSGVSIGL